MQNHLSAYKLSNKKRKSRRIKPSLTSSVYWHEEDCWMTKIDVNTIAVLLDFSFVSSLSLSWWTSSNERKLSLVVLRSMFEWSSECFSPSISSLAILSNRNMCASLIPTYSLQFDFPQRTFSLLLFFDGNLIDRYFIAIIRHKKKKERKKEE